MTTRSSTSCLFTPTGGNRWGRSRRAFSLLEVIIAMAIFLMSIVAIGQLVRLGGEHSIEIEQQGEAVMLAQAKIDEVVAGVLPLSAQSDQSFDEAPDYRWSLTADQNSSISNLYTVTVTVTRERSDGTKVTSSISQLVLDPAQRGSSEDTVAISVSSGGGAGGSSPAGSQGQTGSMQQAQTPGAAASKTGTNASSPKATSPASSTPKTTTAPKTTTPGTTAPKTTTPTTTTPKTTTPSTTPKTTTSKKGG